MKEALKYERSKYSLSENVLPRPVFVLPMCSTHLVRGVINDDNIVRVYCPACGWVHYPTNVTVVCTLVKYGDKLLPFSRRNALQKCLLPCRLVTLNMASRLNRPLSARCTRKRILNHTAAEG